jgi:hypothetical protein
MRRPPLALSFALAALVLTAASVRAAPPPDTVARAEAGMSRAVDWLLARQAADGAWYSETYGAFKDGYSLTPVILLALLYAPEAPGMEAAWRRGSDFLAAAVANAPGHPVRPQPAGYSYPVESLSLSAIVLSMPPNARHRAARDALITELRTRQLGDAAGFPESDPNAGGWGYGQGQVRRPREGLPPDDPRAANLPATLLAVGALRFAGATPDDPALVAARRFVLRCQNFGGPDPALDDGGFFFSPTGDTTNKAGRAGDPARRRFRSYGSMTADGFRALRHLMRGEDATRLVAARDWLLRHFDPARAAGDYATDRGVQQDAVYYYQSWSLAHALAESSPESIDTPRGRIAWGEALATTLLARQRPGRQLRQPGDGSARGRPAARDRRWPSRPWASCDFTGAGASGRR